MNRTPFEKACAVELSMKSSAASSHMWRHVPHLDRLKQPLLPSGSQ